MEKNYICRLSYKTHLYKYKHGRIGGDEAEEGLELF